MSWEEDGVVKYCKNASISLKTASAQILPSVVPAQVYQPLDSSVSPQVLLPAQIYCLQYRSYQPPDSSTNILPPVQVQVLPDS